jgi:hypothetical protein
MEAQAKYLEHRERDYPAALALARRLPEGPDRERRCRRLEARVKGSESIRRGSLLLSLDEGKGTCWNRTATRPPAVDRSA